MDEKWLKLKKKKIQSNKQQVRKVKRERKVVGEKRQREKAKKKFVIERKSLQMKEIKSLQQFINNKIWHKIEQRS